MYYVYILRCEDGTLYTGSTNDVSRRFQAHRAGRGAKYTRSHPPAALVYQEALSDRSAALRREAAIKKLTHQKKWALIAEKGALPEMNEIRRKDRQLSESDAWAVVDKCEYAFLSMTAEDGTPYCVPLTIARDGTNIYFHGAKAGRKAACIEQHPRVCLTCVGDTHIQQEEYSTLYESALAFGTVSAVTGEQEKTEALRLLCLRHTPDAMDGFEAFTARHLTAVGVWCIRVETITGKGKRL